MTSRVLASSRSERRAIGEPLMIAAVWAFVSALLLAQALPGLLTIGPVDPDSQMRLVEVRDFLAGQPWTDLHQFRLNPPDGVVMHWSRLIDWPLATLIRISQPTLGHQGAEVFAISAWPLMLYLVFFFGITSVARRLIGPQGIMPAVAFAVFAAPATGMFVPGHITHHNAQIALFSVLLALSVRIDRGEVMGVFAGIVATLMLAIGLETLPLVGMIAAGLTLTWVFAPRSTGPGLNGFGLFFGAGMVVQRAFTAAPADWLASPCDIASFPYVAVAVIGGVGLAGLVRLNPTSLTLRFAGVGALGVAALAAVVVVNPICLKGPYAEIDPRIVPLWLDHIDEAQSFGQMSIGAPWRLIGLYLAPFLALMPTSWAFACAGRSERAGWGLTLLLLMTALAVSMWESRGATFSSVLVVPGMAYAVTEVRRWASVRGPLVLALSLILVYTLPNQAAETIAADALHRRIATLTATPLTDSPTFGAGASATPFAHCARRDNFAGLAVQPTGTVLIESNLGPSVLLDTAHSTLAAPYHRDAGGLIDGITALDGDFATARAILLRRHVAYVAACPGDPEISLIREQAPDGFLMQLLGGKVPDWLTPVATPGSLKLWRVVDPEHAALPAGSSPDPIVTGSTTQSGSHPTPANPVPGLRGTILP